jgi:RNA polymerase sigma factor (sigma-70 family)
MVYSAAHRMVHDPELAREVAQSVFTTLVQKGRGIQSHQVIGGWLYNTTRHLAMNAVRAEQRRRIREQTAFAMHSLNASSDTPDIREYLESALTGLDETDRDAIILRFFEGRSLREVGAELGISEDAARKRVERALERLRAGLKRHDVTISTALLGPALAATTMAIPPTLVTSIKTMALAATPIAAPSLASAILVALAKAKLATVAIALLFTATAFLVVLRAQKESQALDANSAQRARAGVQPAQQLQQSGSGPARQNVRVFPAAPAADPSLNAVVSAAREFYERGNRFRYERKYDEAFMEYSRAIELIEQGLPAERWIFDAYFARGSLMSSHQVEAKRDHALAIADYTKALAILPNEYSARGNRGSAYTTLKRYDEAVADFTKIIEDPETDFSHFTGGRTNGIAWAYEYRGRAYHEAKDYARAIADFKEALQWGREPSEEVTIHWHIGLCYKSLGRSDEVGRVADSLSERALRWAVASDGMDSERNRAETAARFASEIMDHKNPYQLEVLAAVKAKVGDFSAAESYQRCAIDALAPGSESQREEMQARLELFRARKPLPAR